jgi:recombinational DNA repair protein (RecF pathway)
MPSSFFILRGEDGWYMNKKICSICEKEIDHSKDVARYFTDDDKPLCRKCWESGKDAFAK